MFALGCDINPPDALAAGSAPNIRITSPQGLDAGASRHPIGAPFTVSTDRLLSPRTVTRATFTVTTGPFSVYGGVRYDPARRSVQFVANAGELRPGLEYVFTVHPEVLSWDGVAIAPPPSVHFVPTAPAMAPVRSAVPSLRRDIAPLFSERCARSGCHGPERAAMALDLSSPAAIRATAVGVFSRERPPGPTNTVDITDPEWGGLYLIDPGDTPSQGRPEYSYLVYKLMGDGPMRGEQMPRLSPPLTNTEIQSVSDWIFAGAPDN